MSSIVRKVSSSLLPSSLLLQLTTRLWIHYPVSALNEDVISSISTPSFASLMNSNMKSFVIKDDKKKKYLFDHFYVNTDTMSTQWIAPYKTVLLLSLHY